VQNRPAVFDLEQYPFAVRDSAVTACCLVKQRVFAIFVFNYAINYVNSLRSNSDNLENTTLSGRRNVITDGDIKAGVIIRRRRIGRAVCLRNNR
jgi:hypothetical protein